MLLQVTDPESEAQRSIAAVREVSCETDRFGLYGQVTKRTWWMPWQLKAMKDVVACDKPRGVGKQTLYPRISEWGNPSHLWDTCI